MKNDTRANVIRGRRHVRAAVGRLFHARRMFTAYGQNTLCPSAPRVGEAFIDRFFIDCCRFRRLLTLFGMVTVFVDCFM